MKRNILISNYDDLKNPTYAGGGAVAIYEVAKRLAKNFDVTVLTGNYPGAKSEMVDGVMYARIGPKSFVGRFGQLLYHFILPWHVLTRNYDMWIESFTPPFSTSFIPLFTKKPVIGLVHMLSGKDMRRKYFLPFHHIENIGLRLYRHFIVLTEHSAREIRMENPLANIAIIGNGVHAPSSPNVPGAGKYLGFLGRIEIDQKGLDLLIKAYAAVREKLNIPLLIAGSGSKKEVAHLEKLIDRYNLGDSVQLLGRLEGEKKQEFLRGAVIGVIPSRYETFSLAMLEMMSYGIPVATFDIPGIAWAPQDALVRVPSFDTESLARALVKLAEDTALRETISRRARTYAETRSWDAVANEYERYVVGIFADKNTV